MGIGGTGRQEHGPRRGARLCGFAAAGLFVSATLAAGARPMPSTAVTTLAGSLWAVSTQSATSGWAVGQTSNSNYSKTLVLRWNGTKWAQIPSPSPGLPSGLTGVAAISASNAWAVGYHGGSSGSGSLILHWNGTSWAQVPSPSPGVSGLSGVSAVSGKDVWAVGVTDNRAAIPGTLIVHWNGAKWARVPSPSPGPQGTILNAVRAVSASNAWAVGRYITSAGVGKTLVLHWNGTKWAQVPSPSPGVHDADLFGVSATSASDVWAVGYSDNSIAADLTLVLHWTGTKWAQVPSPSPGGNNSSGLTAVSALTGSDAWASGYYNSAAGGEVTLLLRWNGTSWARVPSPSPGSGTNGSYLAGVGEAAAANAWAVGLSYSTGPAKTLILHWNGTSWAQS